MDYDHSASIQPSGPPRDQSIPNTITYIYIRGIPFSFVHYLCVATAAICNPGATIRFLCETVPDTPAWRQCRDNVPMDVETIEPPSSVFDIPLEHPAHIADVVRLQEMLDRGGVFLDLDVVCVRPFNFASREACVLAEQHKDGLVRGLGCAVAMCRPGSSFVADWISGYDPRRSRWSGFRSHGHDKYWCEMSTDYPAMLATEPRTDLSILSHDYFYPYSWEDDGLVALFEMCMPLSPKTTAIHLWETMSWHRYLKQMTMSEITARANTVTRSAARILSSSKHPRLRLI